MPVTITPISKSPAVTLSTTSKSSPVSLSLISKSLTGTSYGLLVGGTYRLLISSGFILKIQHTTSDGVNISLIQKS